MALEANNQVSSRILTQIRLPPKVVAEIEECPIDILDDEEEEMEQEAQSEESPTVSHEERAGP